MLVDVRVIPAVSLIVLAALPLVIVPVPVVARAIALVALIVAAAPAVPSTREALAFVTVNPNVVAEDVPNVTVAAESVILTIPVVPSAALKVEALVDSALPAVPSPVVPFNARVGVVNEDVPAALLVIEPPRAESEIDEVPVTVSVTAPVPSTIEPVALIK